jgi:RHS repeat-associated protein
VEPFGNNPADENPSGLGAFDLPVRLPGQYFDQETGLHYNYFRDYDTGLGRYVQSDPIGLLGGLNTFIYAANPLDQIDQYGLSGRSKRNFFWQFLPTYGNWGQANWSGGKWSRTVPPKALPPIDPLDSCFRDHDLCYNSIQQGCPLSKSDADAAYDACDALLVACIDRLGPDPKYICATNPTKCRAFMFGARLLFR